MRKFPQVVLPLVLLTWNPVLETQLLPIDLHDSAGLRGSWGAAAGEPREEEMPGDLDGLARAGSERRSSESVCQGLSGQKWSLQRPLPLAVSSLV